MRTPIHFLNVVDIEATCWEGDPPGGQYSEIIEVGIVVMDLSVRNQQRNRKQNNGKTSVIRITDKKSFLIKPIASEVSRYCTELTTITPEMLTNADTFANVCEHLKTDYDSKNRSWASFGNYDRHIFKTEADRKGVEYPFSDKHINIKHIFASLRGEKEVGMAKVLSKIGEPLEGTHHRGHDDAYNTAKIWKYILLNFAGY